jgi:hypothetical protein
MSAFPQLALPFNPPITPKSVPPIPPIYESIESHRKAIYSVAWSSDVITRTSIIPSPYPDFEDSVGGEVKIRYFATCANSYAHVYQVSEHLPQPCVLETGNKGRNKYSINLIQCYKDPIPEEDFYCVAWGGRTGGFPFDPPPSKGVTSGSGQVRPMEMLALAGKGRKINLINPNSGTVVTTLLGHGDEINEIIFVPIGSTDFGRAEDGKREEWGAMCVGGGEMK